MEPARAPVHGLRVVGPLPRRTTATSCVNAVENPLAPPHEPAEPDRPQAGLRVDRSHLPAAQAPRLLALLRRHRAPSPTATTTGWSARRPQQSAGTPGIWNPLPWFDTVTARPRSSATSVPMRQLLRGGQARHAAGGLVGRSRATAVSEHPPALVSAGQAYVTERRQRGHAQPGLELDRDLPRLGRLGRLLRPRRAAAGRRQRLRPARARARDPPVRAARLHRPPDAELRRLRRSSSRTTSCAAQRLDPRTDGRPDPRPTVREHGAAARRPRRATSTSPRSRDRL